ncbi:predicted protein [Aspergillus nidulans FGSC A4]|uniref:Uncharacterized protein n=1 Tax=Emericella nidulans (strain FGSC A4 / ATCC 38163 / CBS 112.46 / NRRL 194 / M139) TaxID=227321 RepID=Q5B2M8_EMENI|nr:hypothetical protein [Aspergillus nidulans FGSC A4]EAA62383.1 predicted protein [Aspergillus nidulans FGSC A4]CBF81072.1 TPA: hypothetical protein ANIA_05202 [Aspergillus nidulans FGSC A4]|eukprot:XP_662806.1 predicted protein [Aspergillus nidulans FGSC A4]
MVDAVFYHKGIKQAYFFGGRGRYARIDFVPGSAGGKITFGLAAIADHWPSLKSIGFGTVDAILPIDGSQDEGYYFSGAHFARIKLVPSSDDDTFVDGPWVITQKLASLNKAGFDTIDAPFLLPGFLVKQWPSLTEADSTLLMQRFLSREVQTALRTSLEEINLRARHK